MAGGHNRRGLAGDVGHARRVGMRSETTTHDRVRREMPRVPCPPRHPIVRPARSHSLPVERHLPGLIRHPPPPGVSLFRRFRCYLDRPPAPYGPPRHPTLPGVSRFRRIGSHLRRVTWAPGPARWQLTPGNRRPPAQHKSIAGGCRSRCALKTGELSATAQPPPPRRKRNRRHKVMW